MVKRKQFSQNKFIRYLVRNRLVPLHRINLAYHEQKRVGGTLAAGLLHRGYISEEDLNRAIAAVMNIPYVELVPEKISRETFETVPAEILNEYQAVPLSFEGRELHVALADPTDPRALHDLALFSKSEVRPAVARRESILFALDYFLGVEEGASRDDYRLAGYSPPEDLPYEEIIQDTTGVTLIYTHLLEAWKRKVPEIHFEPVPRGLRVRYRTNLGLEERALYPPVFKKICLSRLKIIGEFDSPDGYLEAIKTVSLTLGGEKVRWNISFLPSHGGTGALVSFSELSPAYFAGMEELSEQPPVLDFLNLLREGQGLFVLSGKRHFGLTALTNLIFRDAVSSSMKAIAIRSEGRLEEGNYMEIEVEEGNSWGYAQAVRQAARQKPDLIYLDYLEGPAILEQVFQLALAGGTVLARSSFGQARDFLTYLKECDFKSSLIASALRAVLVARSVRLLCRQCRRSISISDGQKEEYPFLKESGWKHLFDPGGCPACRQQGYRGVKWLFELTVLTPPVKQLLFQAQDVGEMRRVWEEKVGSDILTRAQKLLQEGEIDFVEYELLIA